MLLDRNKIGGCYSDRVLPSVSLVLEICLARASWEAKHEARLRSDAKRPEERYDHGTRKRSIPLIRLDLTAYSGPGISFQARMAITKTNASTASDEHRLTCGEQVAKTSRLEACDFQHCDQFHAPPLVCIYVFLEPV